MTDRPAGTYTEWQITGDAGPGFPPYRTVFSEEDHLRRFLAAAPNFHRIVTDVKIQQRTIVISEWEAWTP